MKTSCKITLLLLVLLQSFCFNAMSQITWPEGQLLPTFPAPAQKQDLIYLQSNPGEEKYLFASLKGLVNRTQPRIFSYEGDNAAEGPYTWLNSLSMNYAESSSNWSILRKYLSEVSGLIVYDDEQIHTVNLATTLAKDKNALIAAPSLVAQLTSAPYNLPILDDLRGKFTNKLEVYQTLYDTYWPNTDRRLLIGLNPTNHKASLREYAVALGAAVIWLDPKGISESALLNKFLSSMPEGANYMGWWPAEQPGVERVSDYGMTTIASDFCTNLTFHSGMPRAIDPKPMPAKPALQNKIYVAFTLSDGDNLQYVEHLMRKLWNNSDRGSVPIGWTLSPAMVDVMPGALNYYHRTATENDNLISGPSGYGYTYPNRWNTAKLPAFVEKTEEYNVKAGIRVVTIWNTITGGINANTGRIFAAYAPTLLGVTAQNTGGALSIYRYDDQSLPGRPLSCNYCDGVQTMKDHIATASSGWDRNSPRFVIIQAAPWNNVTPTSFKNVKNSLGADYVVVRPDHIFQLIREANNLSINPGGMEGNGTGLTGTYFNGTNFETETGNRIDADVNFNWGTNPPMDGVDANAFSARWTGQVQPRYTGKYTFYITGNSGYRLWINEQQVINKWSNSQAATNTGTIALTAGQKYNIKMEYSASAGSANCKLEWASPFQSREVAPQSQLYKDMSSGMEDPHLLTGLKLYPNPCVDGTLNIEVDNAGNENIQLTICDISGKPLLKQNFSEARKQLDVSHFSKGLYLVSVRAKNFTKTVQYIVE
jgi:hypothetical protein